MKGCYGGGDGSWLVVEGGPYQDKDGYFQPLDLNIRKVDQEYLFRNGTFTSESHRNFHTKSELTLAHSADSDDK